MNRDGKLSLGWNAVNGASGYGVKLLQLWNGYNEHKIFKRKDQYRVDDHAEQKRALPYFCLRIPDRVRSAGLRGNKTCLRFRTENHSKSKCDQYGDHPKWAKLKGINGYYIYRSASRDSGYTRLARLSENAVSYRVTGLGAEKTYIRVVPYKLVNGKAVTLPHEITTLSR